VIIGSGVVGSSTGKGFAAAGHAVSFVDIDAARVEALRGQGYAATTTVDLPDRPSFVFLTLPTPNQGHRYDLSAFVDGTRAVGRGGGGGRGGPPGGGGGLLHNCSRPPRG
jgi:UDPglucose 6-dehydrogenase